MPLQKCRISGHKSTLATPSPILPPTCFSPALECLLDLGPPAEGVGHRAGSVGARSIPQGSGFCAHSTNVKGSRTNCDLGLQSLCCEGFCHHSNPSIIQGIFQNPTNSTQSAPVGFFPPAFPTHTHTLYHENETNWKSFKAEKGWVVS